MPSLQKTRAAPSLRRSYTRAMCHGSPIVQPWLIDYAQHYKTPLDFIYGSLNGNGDLSPKNISEGRRSAF